jgi:hypothetical protein
MGHCWNLVVVAPALRFFFAPQDVFFGAVVLSPPEMKLYRPCLPHMTASVVMVCNRSVLVCLRADGGGPGGGCLFSIVMMISTQGPKQKMQEVDLDEKSRSTGKEGMPQQNEKKRPVPFTGWIALWQHDHIGWIPYWLAPLGVASDPVPKL